jgi:hypothetical protein
MIITVAVVDFSENLEKRKKRGRNEKEDRK